MVTVVTDSWCHRKSLSPIGTGQWGPQGDIIHPLTRGCRSLRSKDSVSEVLPAPL